MCEYCNCEFNKTYLSKHNERCLIQNIHTEGASRTEGTSRTAKLASHNNIHNKINIDNKNVYYEIDNK